eukprot:Rmarinus@m.29241
MQAEGRGALALREIISEGDGVDFYVKKLDALKKLHQQKVKALMNSNNILRQQAKELKTANKQHHQARLIQDMRKELKHLDLVIFALTKELKDVHVYDDEKISEVVKKRLGARRCKTTKRDDDVVDETEKQVKSLERELRLLQSKYEKSVRDLTELRRKTDLQSSISMAISSRAQPSDDMAAPAPVPSSPRSLSRSSSLRLPASPNRGSKKNLNTVEKAEETEDLRTQLAIEKESLKELRAELDDNYAELQRLAGIEVQVQNISNENSRLKEQLADAREKFLNVNVENRQMHDEISRLRGQLSDRDDLTSVQKKRFQEIQEGLMERETSLRKKNQMLKDRANEATMKLAAAEEKLNSIQRQLSEAERLRDAAQSRLDTAQESLRATERERDLAKAKLDDLDRHHSSSLSALTDSERKRFEEKEESMRQQHLATIQTWEERVSHANEQIKRLEKDNETLQSQVRDVESREATTSAALQDKTADVQGKLQSKDLQLSEYKNAVRTLKQKIEAQSIVSRRTEKKLQDEHDETKKQLSAEKQNNTQLEEELSSLRGELEQAKARLTQREQSESDVGRRLQLLRESLRKKEAEYTQSQNTIRLLRQQTRDLRAEAAQRASEGEMYKARADDAVRLSTTIPNLTGKIKNKKDVEAIKKTITDVYEHKIETLTAEKKQLEETVSRLKGDYASMSETAEKFKNELNELVAEGATNHTQDSNATHSHHISSASPPATGHVSTSPSHEEARVVRESSTAHGLRTRDSAELYGDDDFDTQSFVSGRSETAIDPSSARGKGTEPSSQSTRGTRGTNGDRSGGGQSSTGKGALEWQNSGVSDSVVLRENKNMREGLESLLDEDV